MLCIILQGAKEMATGLLQWLTKTPRLTPSWEPGGSIQKKESVSGPTPALTVRRTSAASMSTTEMLPSS